MREKTFDPKFSYFAIQGGYWMSVCVANSYAAVFLQSRGYSNSGLGLIMAFGNILGFLLAPNLASLVDRSKRINVYHCLLALLCVQAIILICFTLIPGKGPLLSLLYCLYMASVVAVNPLNTELCFELSRWSRPVSYSPARGIGSMCYALMALALGRLTLRLGADVLPFAGLFCLVCQLSFTAFLSFARGRARAGKFTGSTERQEEGLSLLQFIKANSRFCLLMLGTALLFFSYNMADFFLVNIIRAVDGDMGDLGSMNAFKAMLEIPVMVLYTRLTGRFRCSSVMRFAAAAFIAKAVLMAAARSVGMLYAANVLQAFSFALMIPAMVQYVNLVIDPKDSAKGQAIAGGMMTLGAIFASLIGGRLYDAFSVYTTLLVGIVIAACGMVICNITIEKKKA